VLGPDALYDVIDRFAERQSRSAGGKRGGAPRRPDAKRVFDDLFALVVQSRDGL
jgi:hypothetical protein